MHRANLGLNSDIPEIRARSHPLELLGLVAPKQKYKTKMKLQRGMLLHILLNEVEMVILRLIIGPGRSKAGPQFSKSRHTKPVCCSCFSTNVVV